MKKLLTIGLLLSLFMVDTSAQADPLPIKEWTTNAQAPLVVYISGDGGLNQFSKDVCTAISQAGFAVSVINARTYFWDKKQPQQVAADISAYITRLLNGRSNQQVVLTGYSFGADVVPFIVNRLPDALKKKLISVVLLSPSTSTDFEIHVVDLLGGSIKRKMNVVAEINKMQVAKTAIIFGADENDFPVSAISIKNLYSEILPGGHHFEGHTGDVAKLMLRYFK